ncbi:hypothetical protein ACFWXO_36835 [Kitasatospora sp. NPDC059088]|uniref:hypothetical protein n=1 Tax=Kitasatospora sp. NPDC059088 TaxID=3346722 RepID=UPI0036B97C80
MRIFGIGRPSNEVQLFGPLAVDGAVIVCAICGDGGQPGKGHILQVDSEDIRCGKRGHTFTHEAVHELLPAAIRQAPKGAFVIALQDGRTVSGSTNVAGVFAGTEGKDGKGAKGKGAKAAGPKGGGIAGAQAQAAGKGRPGARGGGGGGLAAALGTVNAALGTVTATVGAVGQIAGAAGAGARAVGDIAKAGSNAVSLARDGVALSGKNAAGEHQRGLAQLMNADAQSQRQHEQTMAAARYQDAANAREHRTLRALTQQPKPPQTS